LRPTRVFDALEEGEEDDADDEEDPNAPLKFKVYNSLIIFELILKLLLLYLLKKT
jgi:hypothetical protein